MSFTGTNHPGEFMWTIEKPTSRSVDRQAPGEVTEWPKVHDWKSCVRKRTAGSNPALSAEIFLRVKLAFFVSLAEKDRGWFDLQFGLLI